MMVPMPGQPQPVPAPISGMPTMTFRSDGTGTGASTASMAGSIFNFTFSSLSMTVNPDCTGFMTINLGTGVGVTTNAFVISNGGRLVHAVIAAFTAPNGALATPLQSRIDFWKIASEQDH